MIFSRVMLQMEIFIMKFSRVKDFLMIMMKFCGQNFSVIHEIFSKCRCERKKIPYFRQKNRNRQIAQKLPSLFDSFLSI